MKVLLIEDNKDIADMVRLCLESENILCDATEDGKAGLQSIKKDKFDVILLDADSFVNRAAVRFISTLD